MPKNLAPVASSFPVQTAPLGSEPRGALSIEAPLQNASDRAQYLYDRLMYIDGTREGARRFRRFASVAALKAATDRGDYSFAVIDAVGIFEFDPLSTLTDLPPRVLRPTDIAPESTGRWIMVLYGSLGVANGIPSLDANAKIPPEQMPSGLVYAGFAGAAAGQTVATNDTIFTITGAVVTTPVLKIGDILEITGSAAFQGNNADVCNLLLELEPQGSAALTSTPNNDTMRGASLLRPTLMVYLYQVVGNAVAHTVRLKQAGKAGNAAAGIVSNASLGVKVYRP